MHIPIEGEVYLREEATPIITNRHPWIYRHHIARTNPANLQEGQTVRVFNAKGMPVALAHYTASSTLALRVLTWEPFTRLNLTFWEQRLRTAWQLRQTLQIGPGTPTTGFRLVHAEADLLPGLIIDVYEDLAIALCYTAGMWQARTLLFQAIRTACPFIQAVCFRWVTTNQTEYFGPARPSPYPFKEHGMTFLADWKHGQKSGFFLDQRTNRQRITQVPAQRLLDLFAYSAPFSITYLKYHPDAHALAVDSSAHALDLARETAKINGIADRLTCLRARAFDFLHQTTDQFDLIICDPPAFAKHEQHRARALRAYTTLNRLCIQHLNTTSTPTSIAFLATFSCSEVIRPEDFRRMLFHAIHTYGKVTGTIPHAQILERLHAAPDHPEHVFHPEGAYLKGFLVAIRKQS